MSANDFLPFLKNHPHREEIAQILAASLEAVDPIQAVKNTISRKGNILFVNQNRYSLEDYERIFIIGVGKAAIHLAAGVAEVLNDHSIKGLIISKHLSNASEKLPPGVQILCGDHPVPGIQSLESTKTLIQFCEGFRKKDLVFCVISGGGSSLMTCPVNGVSLDEIQSLTRILLECGANIDEMNVLRKHLDQVKGGGLAKLVFPAKLITLILSDVMGSPLHTIASGPTVADPSTFDDALKILNKYDIRDLIPNSILRHLIEGSCGQKEETLKRGTPAFSSTSTIIVGDNRIACCAAREKAKELGYNSLILTTYLKGEARNAGEFLASILKETIDSNNPINKPFCIICGGETTVSIKGKGLGGRNQEVAIGSVKELSGLKNVTLVTLATDGEDGPTDAAGAIVTGDTLKRAIDKNLTVEEFMMENDSYHFFKPLDSLIRIGPTGTNVNDMNFLFAW